MASNGVSRARRTEPVEMIQGRPITFTPEQILFRELDWNDRNEPIYRDVRSPLRFRDEPEFKTLLKWIAADRDFPTALDRHETVEQDIPVYRESYIVLRIYAASGRTFSNTQAAVKLGTPNARPAAYGGLRYVLPNGQFRIERFDDCRVVFFSALFRPQTGDNPYLQSLWYNIAPLPPAAASASDEEIDPDIRHPGNGGAVPEDPGGPPVPVDDA